MRPTPAPRVSRQKEVQQEEAECIIPEPESVVYRHQAHLEPPVGNNMIYSLDNRREMQGVEAGGDPQCLGWSMTNAQATSSRVGITM